MADPSEPSEQATLSDIDTKYGDVVSLEEVLDQMRAPLPPGQPGLVTT